MWGVQGSLHSVICEWDCLLEPPFGYFPYSLVNEFTVQIISWSVRYVWVLMRSDLMNALRIWGRIENLLRHSPLWFSSNLSILPSESMPKIMVTPCAIFDMLITMHRVPSYWMENTRGGKSVMWLGLIIHRLKKIQRFPSRFEQWWSFQEHWKLPG